MRRPCLAPFLLLGALAVIRSASGAEQPVAPAAITPSKPEIVAAILARPLFAPSRRPAPTRDTLQGTPRLAGITEAGGRAFAIFMVPGRERGLIVPVNGIIGTWQIKAIQGSSVTINEGGRDRVLSPDRDRQASHAASAAPFNAAPFDFAPPASSYNSPPGMPQ